MEIFPNNYTINKIIQIKNLTCNKLFENQDPSNNFLEKI